MIAVTFSSVIEILFMWVLVVYLSYYGGTYVEVHFWAKCRSFFSCMKKNGVAGGMQYAKNKKIKKHDLAIFVFLLFE